MRTDLFPIPTPYPGRLAVAPRPRGGDWLDDEMAGWRAAGAELVVSLLTTGEMAEFNLEGEAAAATASGMRFAGFPIPDRGVPGSRDRFREVVSEVARELAAGHGVVVHCRQGIGRAALVAVGVLVAAGLDPGEAVSRVSAARGRPVPETPAQRRWLDEFAGELSATAKDGRLP
jgi:protein-tyrosine phosphatase